MAGIECREEVEEEKEGVSLILSRYIAQAEKGAAAGEREATTWRACKVAFMIEVPSLRSG